MCLESRCLGDVPRTCWFPVVSVLPELWNPGSQITKIFSPKLTGLLEAPRKAAAISKFSSSIRSGVCR